eukprot:gene27667-49333_t
MAVTLVAGMFWLQQVQVRTIENQQEQQQARAALLAAMDETCQLLRLDAMQNGSVTTLDGAWARAASTVSLGRYLQRIQPGPPVHLQVKIIDAQSRFNLRNLSIDGRIDAAQVAIFRRLLMLLRLDPALAKGTATVLTGEGGASASRFIHLDDLLAIRGYTPQVIAQLREYVVLLPGRSRLNANTAPSALLVAAGGMPAAEADAFVRSREQARLRDA